MLGRGLRKLASLQQRCVTPQPAPTRNLESYTLSLSPETSFDTKVLVGSNDSKRTECQPVDKIQQMASAPQRLRCPFQAWPMAQVLHLPKSSGHRTWKQRLAFSCSCRRRDRSGTARPSASTASAHVTGRLSTLAPLSAVESSAKANGHYKYFQYFQYFQS